MQHYQKMAAKCIIPSMLGTTVLAYFCDNLISDQKLFGGVYFSFLFPAIKCMPSSGLVTILCFTIGTTPKTVTNKEWLKETDKKFQAWPRTAGPPVVMNPISRQNFLVKSNH